MCCLFGIADLKKALSQREKDCLVYALATSAEARGTDATGIAYNADGHLRIYKRPLPAHRMQFHIPGRASVIMGHTRMTTQGSEKRNQNNHPFLGTTQEGKFALAHNGVLYNDKDLQKKYRLPAANIETDSYVAVQLIEKENTLNHNTLQKMAELVRGSFTFSLLDEKDNLYFVKGDNPLCIYQFANGVLAYASTQSILNAGLKGTCLAKLPYKEVKIYSEQIVCFHKDGSKSMGSFTLPEILPSTWRSPAKPAKKENNLSNSHYRSFLLEYANFMGVPEEEMLFLDSTNLTDADLEMALYDSSFRQECLELYGYYGDWEEEDYYSYAGCYLW